MCLNLVEVLMLRKNRRIKAFFKYSQLNIILQYNKRLSNYFILTANIKIILKLYAIHTNNIFLQAEIFTSINNK